MNISALKCFRQTKYNAELHPEICSPGKESQLILLIKKENERRINFIKLIHRIKNMKSQIIHKGRQLFSQRLSKLTDYLFIRFDSLIGSDEIDYLVHFMPKLALKVLSSRWMTKALQLNQPAPQRTQLNANYPPEL
ncbi:unnamed protein product [Trichobilharzia regenti]|nr:unnamed protein product [Trichobilharzia regenti]